MTHYDLLVIGAGSGNMVVDDRFDHWRVAIVERGPYGGTCLNRGCIPSKMYVVPADLAEAAADGRRFGITTSFDAADWPAIRDRIFTRTDANAAGGRAHREQQRNVAVVDGTATFTGPGAVSVALAEGGTAEITADRIVLAVGSRPVVPAIAGLDRVEHHTSDTIMRIASLPARLGIIGGGHVGAEFAHVFSALGSHVVQVESAPVLLGHQDADVARRFTELAARRWDVRLEVSVERVEPTEGGISLHLADGTNVEVDVLLVAVGRTPNTDLLGLERTGVDVDTHGRVVVDEHQRTSAEGVWALGDASSPEALKHVANQDARVVRHNLLHPDEPVTSDHRFVPQAVFSSPQVASVGRTEQQARADGLDVAVATYDYAGTAHGWALEEDDRGHFVKLLADRATGRLVGAHLVGPEASVLVQPLIQAMSFDQPVAGLARGQYWIHPALTEVVENALLRLERELLT